MLNVPAMSQFEVIDGHLTVIHTRQWDYFWGFRKVLANLRGSHG